MNMFNLMHCVEEVRVRVVKICFEDSEGKWFCYPKSPGTDHVELSKHTATSTATLIDALAMTGEKQPIRLIQTMAMLEKSQMLVAQAKVLNGEEDKVSEVDDCAIIRVTLEGAKLGPVLEQLEASTKEYAAFLSNVPRADHEHETFKKFNLQDMTRQLDALRETETNKALDRWHTALSAVCSGLSSIIPEGWKLKAIDAFDSEWVKSKLLTQSMINNLGSDFMHVHRWLEGLVKITSVHKAFSNRYEEDLDSFKEVIANTRLLVGCVLAYNLLLNKFSKASVSTIEKRQAWKDLKKKIKSKLDGEMLPDKVVDRMLAAISSK